MVVVDVYDSVVMAYVDFNVFMMVNFSKKKKLTADYGKNHNCDFVVLVF